MPRVPPMPASHSGNVVTNNVLARLLGRRPSILKAFAELDAATRFHGLLPASLKEAVRQATAERIGCAYCESLGDPDTAGDGRRESLAVTFAMLVAEDPAQITDAQFDVLREEFTEDELVELVAFTCFGIAGQMFGAVMGLEPASPDEAGTYRRIMATRD